MTRRLAILFLLVLGVVACGGGSTRLVTVKVGMGDGAHKVIFSVKNLSDVPINTFYLAKTEAVDKAGGPKLDPNSPEGADVWGPDLGGGALQVGKTEAIEVPGPGRWDARAVDRDGREQIITGLKLQAGGVYVLELYESGWRNFGP
jgi:hypothetical protein